MTFHSFWEKNSKLWKNLPPKNTGYKLGNDKRIFLYKKVNFDSSKGKVCAKKKREKKCIMADLKRSPYLTKLTYHECWSGCNESGEFPLDNMPENQPKNTLWIALYKSLEAGCFFLFKKLFGRCTGHPPKEEWIKFGYMRK